MKLVIFNGSPRGKDSNTRILLERFIDGYWEGGGGRLESQYLNRVKQFPGYLKSFRSADHVILAFPLYTDAMPGIVKEFIESLEPLLKAEKKPSIGFIVQSGFPEPIHSYNLKNYLEKLAGRLGSDCAGTVIRGGVEGIQSMPPWMTRKLFKLFRKLGRAYAGTYRFDPQLISQLAPGDKMTLPGKLVFTLMKLTGTSNFYWDTQLKANKALDKRDRMPYFEGDQPEIS